MATSTGYPGLLGAIVITTLNQTVRLLYDGATENLNVAPGVYFPRGDGSADDIFQAFVDALNTHTHAPVFDIGAPQFKALADDANLDWTISEATRNFTIRFANAATTFDASVLGFPQSDLASVAFQLQSTLSSSAVWIGNAPYRRLDPSGSWARTRTRAAGGQVLAVSRREEFRDYLWVQEQIHEKRFNEEAIPLDPDRAFNRFLRRSAGGLRFEFNRVTLQDFAADEADASGFELIGTFVFDDDFYPQSGDLGTRANGVPLYSFHGHLLPYVAP